MSDGDLMMGWTEAQWIRAMGRIHKVPGFTPLPRGRWVEPQWSPRRVVEYAHAVQEMWRSRFDFDPIPQEADNDGEGGFLRHRVRIIREQLQQNLNLVVPMEAPSSDVRCIQDIERNLSAKIKHLESVRTSVQEVLKYLDD